MTKMLTQIAIFLFSGGLLLSCEKPMDNPEFADRIYNDLLADAKTSTVGAETEKKNLEGIEKDIAAAKPGDNSVKNKSRQRFESLAKIEAFQQKAQYFNLRAIHRKEYVLQTYPKYFAAHKAWPDQEEWADYQAAKRLQMSSRDWSKRVPLLSKRIQKYNEQTAAQFSGGKPPASVEGEKKETPPKEE